MGARRKFSRGGQNHRHWKKLTCFRRAVQKVDFFSAARRRRKRNVLRFSRRFRLKYRVSMASAEGASEKFRVFCRTAAYDVIFLKFHLFLHPPQLRASAPDADEDNVPRTPNVAESFHAHMKQLFNSPRPNQHTSTAGRKVYVNLQSLNCTL